MSKEINDTIQYKTQPKMTTTGNDPFSMAAIAN